MTRPIFIPYAIGSLRSPEHILSMVERATPARRRSNPTPRRNLKFGLAGAFCLLFAGLLLWSKSADPFRRVEFNLPVGSGTISGMAIMPKAIGQHPVIIYAYDRTITPLSCGRTLRQFAELGLAAVAVNWQGKDSDSFQKQSSALLDYIHQQPWALANSVAWISAGSDLSDTLVFAANHPGRQPQLLVHLSGSLVPNPQDGLVSALPVLQSSLSFPILLVHGEAAGDSTLEDGQKLSDLLQKHGATVTLQNIPCKKQVTDLDRSVLFRAVGEYCKAALTPLQPLPQFARLKPWPLALCIAPALLCFILFARPTFFRLPSFSLQPLALSLSLLTAILAIGLTGIHLVLPHLPVSNMTLRIAAKFLVPAQQRRDFDTLAAQPVWQGRPISTLLEHVELAHVTATELVNWKTDDRMYRDFVLSPVIGSNTEDMQWRRDLWKHFYPRIRKEQTPEAAADLVANYLRERLSISDQTSMAFNPETIWNRQVTDEAGFETVYVAALRSVAIPARLGATHHAELWTGTRWQSAPRPLISDFQHDSLIAKNKEAHQYAAVTVSQNSFHDHN